MDNCTQLLSVAASGRNMTWILTYIKLLMACGWHNYQYFMGGLWKKQTIN